MANYQIFISYRRDGGEFLAGRVSDKLTDKGYEVFYDVESMRSGPFNEQIYRAIDQCTDVLLVLPPNALDRCKSEEDWVRKEIVYAMKTGKNVIPLLMPGFVWPADLPEGMENVDKQEGVKVDSSYFNAMIQRIEELIVATPKQKNTEDDSQLKAGVRFLTMKMYAQAQACFEKAIQENLSDPEAYFYGAIAKLEGKRPFLASRTAISDIERYIEAALMYGERGVYYYFYAYVKYDYYEKKLLKSKPLFADLLAKAKELGVDDAESKELFTLTNTQKPDIF